MRDRPTMVDGKLVPGPSTPPVFDRSIAIWLHTASVQQLEATKRFSTYMCVVSQYHCSFCTFAAYNLLSPPHALVPLVVQPHNFRIITRIRWFHDVRSYLYHNNTDINLQLTICLASFPAFHTSSFWTLAVYAVILQAIKNWRCKRPGTRLPSAIVGRSRI